MVKLGTKVRDSITGFEGIAIARTQYLYGCVQIGVEPLIAEGGKKRDTEWFDEQRIDLMSPARSGGPGETPPPREVPHS